MKPLKDNRKTAAKYSAFLANNYLVATYVWIDKCQGLPNLWPGIDWIRLDIGLNLRIPIPDLIVDSNGIMGTLSFRHKPYHIIIPWSAVEEFIGSEEADARSIKEHQEPMKPADKVIGREGNVVKVRFGK